MAQAACNAPVAAAGADKECGVGNNAPAPWTRPLVVAENLPKG